MMDCLATIASIRRESGCYDLAGFRRRPLVVAIVLLDIGIARAGGHPQHPVLYRAELRPYGPSAPSG